MPSARQWRAKKRADRNVARKLAGDDASNVTRLAPGIGNVTGNVAGNRNVARNGVTFAPARGNVRPSAIDTAPIAMLLEEGCDLDVDVLSTVRDLITHPLQPPLKSWGLPWLAEEIIRRRDARMASDRVTQVPAAARAASVPRRAAERATVGDFVPGYETSSGRTFRAGGTRTRRNLSRHPLRGHGHISKPTP